ncbi:MAG: DUF4340 domain-containing protein, partial [Oligoflexia bacterium]|nr:DUF4340 domain-containing protein [Oligoflexia bacterium]
MRLTSKTWLLLVVAVLLLLANVLKLGGGPTADLLPTIVALRPQQITRIELSNSVRKVVLVPQDDAAVAATVDSADPQERSWRLLAPIQAAADQQMIRSLLAAFRQDVPIDVRVDQGNLEDYGLNAGNGIIVELWAGGDLPKVSLTVGSDAPGGSNFIRLSGDDAIYRARVGGRDRFTTRASQWRNRVPLQFSRQDVTRLSLTRPGADPVVLVRQPPAPGDAVGTWALDPPAPWPVDSEAIEAVLYRLVGLRADEVLADDFAGGFDHPLVTATFGLADGSEHSLILGSRRHPDAAFIRVVGDPAVYRVPRRAVLDLARTRQGLRDKTLITVNAADIDTIALEEQGRTWMVRQAGGTDHWQVVQPPNVDLDVGRVAQAAHRLAALRADAVADGLAPRDAGLLTPDATLTLTLIDGTQ